MISKFQIGQQELAKDIALFHSRFNSNIKDIENKYIFNNRKKTESKVNEQQNIPQRTECKDTVYAVCQQSFDSDSYLKTANMMYNEKIANISDSALKKKRERRGHEMFEELHTKTQKLFYDYKKDKSVEDNCDHDDDSSIKEKNEQGNVNDINATDSYTKLKQCACAVDGSKLSVYGNLKKNGKVQLNKNGKTGRLLISTVLDTITDEPISIQITPQLGEQPSFKEQLEKMVGYYVFLFDRLYYHFDLLEKIVNRGCDAFFRMQIKENCFKDFWNGKSKDIIMYIKGVKRVGKNTRGAIKVRLLKYKIGDTQYVMLTTLTDKNKYKYAYLTEFYTVRWRVETFYKLLKHELKLKYTRAKLMNTLLQEFHCKLFAITLTKVFIGMYLYHIGPPKDKYKISFSCCMKTVMKFIFPLLIYKQQNINTTNEIMYHVMGFGKNIYYNPESKTRKYPRQANKTCYVWYYLKYVRESEKKKEEDAKAKKQEIKLKSDNASSVDKNINPIDPDSINSENNIPNDISSEKIEIKIDTNNDENQKNSVQCNKNKLRLIKEKKRQATKAIKAAKKMSNDTASEVKLATEAAAKAIEKHAQAIANAEKIVAEVTALETKKKELIKEDRDAKAVTKATAKAILKADEKKIKAIAKAEKIAEEAANKAKDAVSKAAEIMINANTAPKVVENANKAAERAVHKADTAAEKIKEAKEMIVNIKLPIRRPRKKQLAIAESNVPTSTDDKNNQEIINNVSPETQTQTNTSVKEETSTKNTAYTTDTINGTKKVANDKQPICKPQKKQIVKKSNISSSINNKQEKITTGVTATTKKIKAK